MWNIAGYYAALLPFFFLAGLFIGLSFVLNARRIGIVYAWDLAGAGVGAACVTALMFVLGPLDLVPALLVPLAGSAAAVRRGKAPVLAACVALVLAEAVLLAGGRPGVNEYKPIYAPLHTQGARILAERLSPRGQYQLLDDFTERVDTDISNDSGQLGLSGPPRAFGLYRDGTRIAALPRATPDVGYARAALGCGALRDYPRGGCVADRRLGRLPRRRVAGAWREAGRCLGTRPHPGRRLAERTGARAAAGDRSAGAAARLAAARRRAGGWPIRRR